MNTGINHYIMIICIFYNFVVIDPASVDILIYVLFFSVLVTTVYSKELKQRRRPRLRNVINLKSELNFASSNYFIPFNSSNFGKVFWGFVAGDKRSPRS